MPFNLKKSNCVFNPTIIIKWVIKRHYLQNNCESITEYVCLFLLLIAKKTMISKTIPSRSDVANNLIIIFIWAFVVQSHEVASDICSHVVSERYE